MPVGFSSAARNLFLLGSSGAQVISNFFKTIEQSAGTDGVYLPDEIKYIDSSKKYALSGTAEDSNSKGFGWLERQDYNLETGSLTTDYSVRIESTQAGVNTTLRAMELDANDNLIVVGFSGAAPWIAKYSNDGVLDWQSTTNSANVRYLGVTSDSNGNYYACGRTSLSASDTQAFIEKFDSNGNPGWGKSAFMLGRDVVLEKISVNDRGEVVAVGYLEDDSAYKGYIIKIDANTGEVLWDRTLRSYVEDATFGYSPVFCEGVFVDSRDQIYVVGRLFGVSETRGFIVKYTPEGNIIWQKETPVGENIEYYEVKSDGETEQTIVFGRYIDSFGNTGGILSKYSRDGELVWRRTMFSSYNNSNAFGQAGGAGICLDADPSFYYFLYIDDTISSLNGTPQAYTFGKVSSSGNGLGAFEYAEGTGETIDYEIFAVSDVVGRLSDGSVRQDTSDLITYPFNANKILFDDLATQVSNKKRQMDDAGSFEYSGSPAIRVADFQELNLLGNTGRTSAVAATYNNIDPSNANNYSMGTQRENDFRSQVVVSGLTGFTRIDIDTSYSWSGSNGGSLSQNTYLRNSSNTTISSSSGGGLSGNYSFSVTGLDPNETYNIYHTSTSSGSTGFYEINASGTITWDGYETLAGTDGGWVDQSGKGNNAVVPFPQPGASGPTINAAGYWEFDGSDDEITIDTFPDLSNVTVEWWGTSNNPFFNYKTPITRTTNNSWTDGFGFYQYDGTLSFWINAWNGGQSATTSETTFGFTHWVGTYDGSNLKLYKNGSLVTTGAAYSTAMTNPNVSLDIGHSKGNFNWTGNIGEVRIYPRALTAAQVFQNYNSTKSKYINEAPDTAPKIGPGIVYDSNLLLNYDFGNRATYDDKLYDRPFVGPAGVNGSLVKINGTTNDQFGTAVDIGGGKLVVGESSYDSPQFNSGRIHVMDLDGSNAFTIEPTGLNSQAYLGGSAYVYNNYIFSSTLQDELYRFSLDGTGETIISNPTGRSLKAPTIDKTSGKIAYREDPFTYDRWYIADFDGTNITNEVTLTPPSDAQRPDIYNTTMGYGKIALQDTRWSEVGGSVANNNDDDGTNYEGRVYVYDQDGTNEIILRAPDVDAYREVYTDWDNSHYYGGFGRQYTQFGSSVAFGPDRIVVGCDLDFDLSKANPDTDDYWYAGAAYIFDHSGNFIRKITGSTVIGNAYFGSRVNVYDNKIFVGAAYHNSDGSGTSGPGAVFVFDLDGNELGIIPAPAGIGDYDLFGGYDQSIAYDSDTGKVAITASRDDGNQGSVSVFDTKHSLPTTVKNLSSSSHTGTLNGGAFVDTANGHLDLDGSATQELEFGSTDWGGVISIEMWIKTRETAQEIIAELVATATNHIGSDVGFRITRGGNLSNELRFGFRGNVNFQSGFTFTNNQWEHYVITFDDTDPETASGFTSYKNGSSGTVTDGGTTVLSGTFTTNKLLRHDMEIGEFRIYDKVLTATEVSQNYNATRGKYGV